MPIPDFQSFMLPVLKAGAEGEVWFRDVARKVSDEYGLSDEERSKLLPSGKQRVVDNRVHWARTFLAKAGLVEPTKRGYYQATALGKEVLAQALTRIDNKFLSQFPGFNEFRYGNGSSKADEIDDVAPIQVSTTRTPDEVMRSALKQIEAALRDELISRIIAAPPSLFEQLVVKLLLAMGYGGSVENAGRVLGKSGDNGVDGVVDQDALGLDRVYVQAKRYSPGNNIDPSQIRDFFGSLDHFKASKGIFITSSSFTQGARETADRLSKRIVLIDGTQLAQLMIRYNVGCRIEEVLHLNRVDEDFFLDQ